MKKLFILFLLPLVSFAQSNDGFSYSAIVRDAQGAVLPNTTVGIEVTVLADSTSGSAVYSETHNAVTDGYGVVALIVGNGTVQSGSLLGIDWGATNHYLEVGIDLSGGSNYAVLSTTQIMSVPYALHARKADTASYVSASQSPKHYIGEFFQGGVIFHLWEDSTGQHGLIVSPVGMASPPYWSNIQSTLAGANDYYDGYYNTQKIINQSGHINSYAKACADYNGGGFSDWYLPSVAEAELIARNHYSINKTLKINPMYNLFNLYDYVRLATSTEDDNANFPSSTFVTWVHLEHRTEGVSKSRSNNSSMVIRAIRSF